MVKLVQDLQKSHKKIPSDRFIKSFIDLLNSASDAIWESCAVMWSMMTGQEMRRHFFPSSARTDGTVNRMENQKMIYRYTSQPEKVDVLKVYSQLNILMPHDKLRVSRRADERYLKPGGWQQERNHLFVKKYPNFSLSFFNRWSVCDLKDCHWSQYLSVCRSPQV